MKDPEAEATIRAHFKGADLERKLAELRSVPDAAESEAIQSPLRVALGTVIRDYVLDGQKKGVRVSPRDVTMALLDLLCSHTCRTREKSLSMSVIIHQVALALATRMKCWWHHYAAIEAKDQPGG